MNQSKETTTPNLTETANGGKRSFAKDQEKNPLGTNYETKLHEYQEGDVIPTENQARDGAPQEGVLPQEKNLRSKPSTPETESETMGHLSGENATLAISAMISPKSKVGPTAADSTNSSPRRRVPVKAKREKVGLDSTEGTLEELKKQNFHLMEALMKTQKIHAADKKCFHEVLLGIDRALSSLPIRLEKIRVRNQRNLTMLKSSRLYSGDGNATEESAWESSASSEYLTETSQEGQTHVSSRMKSLLQKIDQLNDLIGNIHEGDSSPIELLVNSELYAISLLKKEIKSTKRKIDDNKTDTETLPSMDDSPKESPSKAKNPFSNELNKASNFKIFENHMMLQEEALNLLTRKIKETEEALLKEVEEKESLKRENETMAKEIFRLKSGGEDPREEKSQKTEKLKLEPEGTGNRPYRLIKELRAKLDEKEKALIAYKSKYSRLETASSNRTNLLENERKKNAQLETSVKNLQIQNKAMSSQINSLQMLNDQLREQLKILKHQVEILARQHLEELNSLTRDPKVNEMIGRIPIIQKRLKEMQKEAENKVEVMKKHYEEQLDSVRVELQRHQGKNEQFADTFKELLMNINNFELEKDLKTLGNPSYDKVREILHVTPSDLELLFTAYAKSSAEKEVEKLYEDFKSIVNGEENKFSETLSAWLFDIILEKMCGWGSSEEKIRKLILE